MATLAPQPRRRLLRAGFGVVAVLAAAAPAPVTLAADPIEVLFSATGAEQTFVVPDDVMAIHVVLVGGRGGAGRQGAPGGHGARVEGDLTVVPGATLYIEVGGNATDVTGTNSAGGFNGGGTGGGSGSTNWFGGGGGGASDLRTIDRTSPGTLQSRLIVAAGGAGGGGGPGSGSGGNAGASGANEQAGGLGGGAGQATGGGTAGGGNSSGTAGAIGIGGAGGPGDGGGGGGGAGLYGGGGGGASFGGAGGGGGSSYLGNATAASIAVDGTGVPSVSITYMPGGTEPPPSTGPGTGVVSADVTVPDSAACIELSTTSVTFGTQRFGGETLEATPRIELSNCSANPANVLARGTDATGSSATWNLVDGGGTCDAGTLAIDDYHLKLRREDSGETVQLSESNRALLGIGAGAVQRVDALLDMPCPGSTGAGETMGMQIVFVVTE